MAGKKDGAQAVKKFAGIEIPPDLTTGNFIFLYFNTLLIGCLMVIPAILQPAFLKDIINVSLDFFGSINGLLQNMSQVATLLFVGYVGILFGPGGKKNSCHHWICCTRCLFLLLFIFQPDCCCLAFTGRIFCQPLCSFKLCPFPCCRV